MGSLADCVLTNTILIPPHPPLPPTNLKKVRGPQNSTETSNRNPIYCTSKYIKGDVGMVKRFSKLRKQGMSFQLRAIRIKVVSL